MSINYTTVFTGYGSIVARINSYAALAATTLPADLAIIVAIFGDSSTTFSVTSAPISGLPASYAGFSSAVVSWRTSLQGYCQNVFTDRDTVTSQLPLLTQTDIRSVMQALISDMIANSQTVLHNAITIGSITAAGTNTGTGTATVSTTLDGYNAPIQGTFAHVAYTGVPSQMAVPSETMELVCTGDSYSGGLQEGSETWTWNGGTNNGPYSYLGEGSGTGPGLTTAHGATIVRDLNFTVWSGGTPALTNWTALVGVYGTDIVREASVIFRSTYAGKFVGAGTLKPSITQPISINQLQNRRQYIGTFMLRKGGSTATNSEKITISLTGTGYSPATAEKIDVLVTSLTTSYALYSFVVNLPAVIPSDLALTLQITAGNLTSGTIVYFASGSFSAPPFHGGVAVVITSGTTPWIRGDSLSFTVTNTTTGKFQDATRKAFKCQLPSVASSPSISEALVV